MGKKPGKDTWIKTKTIGIVGAMPGIGVTHLTLAIANYIAAKERLTVAVAEVKPETAQMKAGESKQGGEDSRQSRLADMITKDLRLEGEQLAFQMKDVIYYPDCSPKEALTVGEKSYHYVIYDIETYDASGRSLMLRCDTRILLGSTKPWCYGVYGRFLRDKIIKQQDMEQIKCYAFSLEKEEKSKFEKDFHATIYNLPYLPNPFCIRQADFPFLQKILSGS